MALLAIRLIVVFVVGACLGSFVNWAIYASGVEPAADFAVVAADRPVLRRGAGLIACRSWAGSRCGAKRRFTARGFGCGRCLLEIGRRGRARGALLVGS